MADREKEFEPMTEDPAVAVGDTNHDEPTDSDNNEQEEKDCIEFTSHGSSSSHSGSDIQSIKKGPRPDIHATKSYATDTSAVTRTDSHVDVQAKKSWYKNLNPLRWGGIPPVPKTRKVSREYNASFFSLVYFQWVAPMMSVSTSDASLADSYTDTL